MTSEIGQHCRTIAQRAMELDSPCIQIVPVYPNDLEVWSRIYFYFSEMAKSVEKKIGLPFLISIEETGAKKVQCPDSDTGFHEYMDLKNKAFEDGHLFCINCGAITLKTTRTPEQLKEFFMNKQFKRKEIPRDNKDFDQF